MRTAKSAVVVALLLSIVACGDPTGPIGPTTETFTVRGVVASGQEIEIKGINGTITATHTPGEEFVLATVQRGFEDDPADVHIDVVRHAGGVTICAVYPDVPGRAPNECAPGDAGQLSVRSHDVQVDFAVSVPASVTFVGRNVNGGIAATDLHANAFLSTVNGDVVLTTSRIGSASTLNGDVEVEIGITDWDRDLDFATLNGDVVVRVPAGTNADALLTTFSGRASSDFALDVVSVRDLRGTLGSGGGLVTLSSLNGNVALLRGS